MLLKVSSALSALISPITSSNSHGAGQASSHTKDAKGFHRYKATDGDGQKKHPPGSQGESDAKSGKDSRAQVIPIRPGAENQPVAADHALAAPKPFDPKALSVAHAFVQLIGMFGKSSSMITQWLGNTAYQKVSAMKKGSKFKRGAMLDTRVE